MVKEVEDIINNSLKDSYDIQTTLGNLQIQCNLHQNFNGHLYKKNGKDEIYINPQILPYDQTQK